MDIERVVRTILEKSPGLQAKCLVKRVIKKRDLGRSTIYDHLYRLALREMIFREKGRYWWGKPPAKTRMDNVALTHSKRLILGLEAVLREDKYRWLEEKQGSRLNSKVKTEGMRLKPFAEEHLRTGYPHLHEELQAHRKLKDEIRLSLVELGFSEDLLRAVGSDIQHIDPMFLSGRQRKGLEESIPKIVASYEKLATTVRLLEEKVRMGKPLLGNCQLCSG